MYVLYGLGLMMAEPVFRVDHAALAGVKSSCSTSATSLGQAGFGPKSAAQLAVDAAGEFSTEVELSAMAFTASWFAIFGVCSQEATVMANNVGAFSIDTSKTDTDHGYQIK